MSAVSLFLKIMGFAYTYRWHFWCTVLAFIALNVLPVFAQDTRLQNPETREVSVLSVRGESILVDGILDEACWQKAVATGDFLQREPVEGAPATLKTEVRFCFDDEALYIGATMYVDDPAEIISTLSRRDNAGNSERIIFSMDTYHDNRTAYSYGVTADGVRFEYYHSEDSEHSRDYSYDPVWEARVKQTDRFWSAEMRIPLSQLRFNEASSQLWGLNMNRFIPSRNEDVYWVLIPKNVSGWSSRFGHMVGIEGISPSSRIELTPYVAADLTTRHVEDNQNPFDKQTDWGSNTGIDLKMGLGPNLTLDATINPDFGQVEADPAEVNLSAYESFYSERRPFFIEGSQLLRGRGPDYFYSRRIGAPPQLSSSAQYSDNPGKTSIIGAAKLSGRLSSGLSIGALGAMTEREFVETYDPTTNTYGEEEIAPLSGIGVIRLQQEIDDEASTVGVILTGVERDLRTRSAEDLLTRRAVSGGVDWNLRFDHGGYELEGFAGYSDISGTREAISRVQQRSTHYYQRPDADHVTFDPERTSLSGYAASLSFDKNSGEHWLWGLGGSAESPGFEINDAGRLHAADDIDSWVDLEYRENTPGTLFHSYRFELQLANGWNFDGIRQYTNLGLSVHPTFTNFWRAAVYFDYGLDALADHMTRGGPLMNTGAGWNLYGTLSNNYSSDTRWSVYASTFRTELDAWNYSVGGSFSVRTSGRWDISIEPGYTRSVSTRQYLMSTDNGPEATFGRRYLFSTIDQATLFARLRINYAFSPDLTLEVYAEPFAASGNYLGFGLLPAARDTYLMIYGSDPGTSLAYDESTGMYTATDAGGSVAFPNPDFNVLSYRSNVVLRWEWVRGSTLFLVWQQNRSNYEARGAIINPLDLFESFNSPGANFIALKITYWIPLT
ncbi:MAG: hypothetical protein C0600_06905 [Ignavibacteria bacterium]|nr:MAG: hypothetical protein C0600_06905 [Ignavibacteria bacterium]